MIEHRKVILTDDIAEQHFVCDLERCKGACCVEGDLGAPLEEEELDILDEIYPEVAPYLTDEGREVIENTGAYILDEDGDYSTPTIGGRECAYAIYDENKILKCGIEQAYLDGKVSFKKPISCHLYPARVKRYDEFEAVNYDVWSICSPACSLGEALKVPLYKFLKEALVRRYGEDWYDSFVELIENNSNGDSKEQI